jgi:streptomycin 6-kinase
MLHNHALPASFVKTVTDLCGETGQVWLETLPRQLSELADHWSITIGPPFPLSFHYVAPATRSDGSPAVVKLGRPDAEFFQEYAALQWFHGNGMVRILDALPDRRALLLERILPGDMLADLFDAGKDDEATAIIAETMRRIRRPVPEGDAASLFPTATEWGAGLCSLRDRFGGGTGPLPRHLVEEAEDCWHNLLVSSSTLAFLHGDLHHFNVLRSMDGDYVAIDPKGLIADPCYEVGPLFYNPGPHFARHPDARRLTERRVTILSERTGFSRERIRAWGLAQAVLSAWWCIEDGADLDAGQETILCAEHLAAVT